MRTYKYVLISLIILSGYSPLSACTSFAVYGNKIFYGMNFDYPQVELKFSIIHYEGMRVFQVQFIENGNILAVCGMNSSGVFSSIQMLYPQVSSWPEKKENEIDLYEAYILSLLQVDSLQESLDFIESSGTKVIQINGSTLHDFFADKTGKAYVLEVGTEKNLLTNMENDFMVMTNFPNNQFVGKPLEQISGTGADRYKTAYQYIQANKDDFNFDDGIETLRRTMQTSGGFATQVSLIFDPLSNEAYIILKRNFNKIWKVSINDETIETFSGFDQHQKMPLTSEGILASELQNITSVNDKKDLIPATFNLEQNYPNPFNPKTRISFSIPEGDNVTLKVYNILGNETATLINEYKNAGKYAIEFDASTLSSGIYMYCLKAGNYTAVRKLVLIK